MVKRKCVFLDRDGVINIPEFRGGRSFAPRTFSAFQIYQDACEACKVLKESGYFIVVITNQPDVGNGLVDKAEVDKMHDYLLSLGLVDDIFACYHSQSDNCMCRKPNPGMILAAVEKYNIDLNESFVIGDRKSDIDAAHLAKCRSIFIDHDYLEEKPVFQDATFSDLKSSAFYILNLKDRI